jgi:hypothetical protein
MHIPPVVQLSSARTHWLTGHVLARCQLASTPTRVVLLACHVSEQAASCRCQGAPRLGAVWWPPQTRPSPRRHRRSDRPGAPRRCSTASPARCARESCSRSWAREGPAS